VEVVGRGLNGPEVLALLAVSAGPEPEIVALAPTIRAEPADPAQAEVQVLEAVNATRGRHGLPPLQASAALRAVAAAHSAEMLRQGLLAHNLPGSGDLGERLQRARVPFLKALENLAKGQTAMAAHEATEESPVHRNNLLASGPTLAGIGIARGELPGGGPVVYLTEVFVAPPGEAGRGAVDGAVAR